MAARYDPLSWVAPGGYGRAPGTLADGRIAEHRRIADQYLRHLPVGRDHVQDARRQPDFLGDLTDQVPLTRCLGRRGWLGAMATRRRFR
jgi:hypothetical protein